MRLHVEHPLDIDDARRASRRLAELRRDAEDHLAETVEKSADAEHAYRKALAQAHARRSSFKGTAAARDAHARADVADEARERDIAEGMVKVATERLRGLEREGAALRSLSEWSLKMWDRETPPATQTYGQRAA